MQTKNHVLFCKLFCLFWFCFIFTRRSVKLKLIKNPKTQRSELKKKKKPNQNTQEQTTNHRTERSFILKCKAQDITEDTKNIQQIYQVNKIGTIADYGTYSGPASPEI